MKSPALETLTLCGQVEGQSSGAVDPEAGFSHPEEDLAHPEAGLSHHEAGPSRKGFGPLLGAQVPTAPFKLTICSPI